MSGVCPGCGVTVVPGYVRCPKCHAGLPQVGRRASAAQEAGGTAVVQRGFPISAVLAAVGVAAAIILVFGLRSDDAPPADPGEPARPIAATGPARPPVVAAPPAAPAAPEPAAQDPRTIAAAVEDMLRRERLWGRVQIMGSQIDLRSGSCSDAAMEPAIEGQKAMLRDAGLTKLRCLAQSGAVVFERDL